MLSIPKSGESKAHTSLPKDLSKELAALKKENAALKRDLAKAKKAAPRPPAPTQRSGAATAERSQPDATEDVLLAVEKAYYDELKPELLKKHLGKYVVVKGPKLIGIYDDGKTAYLAGRKLLGNVPMLLREVTLKERVYTFPSVFFDLRHDAPA